MIGYGIGRFWIEGLRIDPTKEGGGLRLNQWMSIVLIVAGVAYLVWARLRPAPTVVADGEVPSAP